MKEIARLGAEGGSSESGLWRLMLQCPVGLNGGWP